jgi:hypothetical protein
MRVYHNKYCDATSVTLNASQKQLKREKALIDIPPVMTFTQKILFMTWGIYRGNQPVSGDWNLMSSKSHFNFNGLQAGWRRMIYSQKLYLIILGLIYFSSSFSMLIILPKNWLSRTLSQTLPTCMRTGIIEVFLGAESLFIFSSTSVIAVKPIKCGVVLRASCCFWGAIGCDSIFKRLAVSRKMGP